jgi:hypothetical protein
MLEYEVIHSGMLDDQGKAIEVLDARLEFAPVEQV